MSNRKAAAIIASFTFLIVVLAAIALVRTKFRAGYIPEPYSIAIVLLPPFPAAVAAYKLALRRRRGVVGE